MTLTSKIIIDDRLLASFPMHHMSQDLAKNQYAVRTWIQNRRININADIRVLIFKDNALLFNLRLLQTDQPDNVILTAKEEKQSIYGWATLTKGLGETWGFTAGVLIRHKQPLKVIEEQGSLFNGQC